LSFSSNVIARFSDAGLSVALNPTMAVRAAFQVSGFLL
jgi:hypothetical protein